MSESGSGGDQKVSEARGGLRSPVSKHPANGQRRPDVVHKPLSPQAFERFIHFWGSYVAHAKSFGDVVLLVLAARDVFKVVYKRHGPGMELGIGEFRCERAQAIPVFMEFLKKENIHYTKIVGNPAWK